MKCIDFNFDWTCKALNGDSSKKVTIPHDAMFSEKRSETNAGGGNISWFSGGDYEYEKIFHVPAEYALKHIVFEFEGVYRNAEVYINGQRAAYRPYGYTNFYVNADSYLTYDSDNVVKVIAKNSDQPNSRWYSGSGIYRPVYMYLMDQKHIRMNGIRIKTLSMKPAIISVEVVTNDTGMLKVEILENKQLVAAVAEQTSGKKIFEIEVPEGKLWSIDQPFMYECQVTFHEDVVNCCFGIRKVTWDHVKGLEMNGNRVILKGACIHHDNGLLGACAFEEAERRKVRLLQEVGYNAIRSAHNPCSKAMLKACDELGMLVMDEYVDMWYIHKTEYDYADYFAAWWKEDLKNLVEKDYNHPSVILYSTGNEVSETSQERGIKITRDMTEYLHRLDDTRPVSCGVNIFFNFLSSIGFGIYSDEKAKKQAHQMEGNSKSKKKAVGSEFYNTLAGRLGDKAMKIGATFYGCDIKTREAFANMDIAGYNYGILRYKHDLKRYPDRLILGSETFCRDAYAFVELAKKHPRLIGDFVWAGMDYLGEVGIGAWVYKDYAPEFEDRVGWLTAGSGRIDITGRQTGEAAYTKVALEKTIGPLIAVKPVYQKGKHSPSAWKLTDALESWTWPGCDGEEAVIEIYARASFLEVFINDKLVGKRKIKNGCRTLIKAPYKDGKITAITYDRHRNEIGRHTLKTASSETLLSILPEERTIKPNGLCYVRLVYTDAEGIVKPMEKHRVHVEVEGGTLLALGNACPYNPEGYTTDNTSTYYGEAMAVIRADIDTTKAIKVRVTDGEIESVVHIPLSC